MPSAEESTRSADPALGVRVSVVVPVKDDAGDLAECLRALAAQTRPPDEVVVVDNGSRDETSRVALAAGARVVPCLEPGIPAASAEGYDAARGELLLRLDADCRPAPDWVERIESAFARSPHVGAITGGARFVDGPRPLRIPLAVLYLGAYAGTTSLALGHAPLFGSNLALRRSVWLDVRDAVHRHDPEVHDDLDLAFHIGDRHRIRYRRGLAMGISMRPFQDAAAFGQRMRRGIRTVTVHWPHDFPPRRWLRLWTRRGVAARATAVNPRDTAARR
ncbi:glycosyltransferase family A protein [Microbacterium sp. NPDC057407]|uniref:glycosyltransferase family A protein n=1 Tax=Microbacterium sp. NPDC057407 TaxID=3346120 RepID=UPI00366B0698